MRVAEMEELITIAESQGLVLMPGHLLLYHPGVQKLKELVEEGELGDVLVVYGNRQNLGKIRKDENALWSLGVHDLSVILYLIQEEIVEAAAHGHAFLNEGVEDVVFCYLRFGSGKIAHMHLSWLDPHKMRRFTVVGRDKMAVFDDMDLDRKITVYDKAPGAAVRHLRRVADADRRHLQPEGLERRASAARMPALRAARAGRLGRPRDARRARGRARARVAHGVAAWLRSNRRRSASPRSRGGNHVSPTSPLLSLLWGNLPVPPHPLHTVGSHSRP